MQAKMSYLLGSACACMLACSSPTAPGGQATQAVQGCSAGSTLPCTCPAGQSAFQVCAADGSGYLACPACSGATTGGSTSGTGGIAFGTGGAPLTGGVAALTGGVVPVTGGISNTGGVVPVTGGVAPVTGGAATTGGLATTGGVASTGGDSNASGSVSGISDSELEMLRQLCVDEINMYRATMQLPPLTRGSMDQELCSDQGAKKDGDGGGAHSSAGTKNPCNTTGSYGAFPNFGAQDSCPGYMVGGFGSATIADALKQCLQQMWAEGDPADDPKYMVSIDQCIQQYQMGDSACFLAHGHFINMSGDSAGVSCGFYDMGNSTYWMNQDFF